MTVFSAGVISTDAITNLRDTYPAIYENLIMGEQKYLSQGGKTVHLRDYNLCDTYFRKKTSDTYR